jgi:hypothetical protein
MDIQLTPPEFCPIYFIPEEETMDDLMDLYYPTDCPRYQSCKCGCCMSCVGLSDRDFM